MELHDEVITLRPFKIEDAQEHLEGEDNEQVKWLSGGKSTLEGVQNWIEKNQKQWGENGHIYNFAIVDSNNKLVGMVEANSDYKNLEGLQEKDANISYGLYPFARSKGYATRAVNLITEFLKDKNFERAVIRVNPENENSLKLPLRCGFIEQGEVTTKSSERLKIFIKNL
ncbi:MAG: GNAT family N-acetyltransferase [Candidatus Levybacteria bacterium]|nr:GNAT family N-acetyltransferase [Candidatus Levybacteria bacterium]MBP9815423.1 GNAT family N-acetyltransferase [Candidatus Levybacteria bacterium]